MKLLNLVCSFVAEVKSLSVATQHELHDVKSCSCRFAMSQQGHSQLRSISTATASATLGGVDSFYDYRKALSTMIPTQIS